MVVSMLMLNIVEKVEKMKEPMEKAAAEEPDKRRKEIDLKSIMLYVCIL